MNLFGLNRNDLQTAFGPQSHVVKGGKVHYLMQSLYQSGLSDLRRSGEGFSFDEPKLSKASIKGLASFLEEESNPPRSLKHSQLPIMPTEILESSSDGSIKMVSAVRGTTDLFESVLIPERGRLTLCVSSQVGCAQGCRFCQTGQMGLKRSLSAAEIVAQVVLANAVWKWVSAEIPSFGSSRVTNVVFMGMGEPLDNVDAVLKACSIMTDPWGLGIGNGKITISTVGLPLAMQKVLTESNYHLALSLHSPFEEERSRMMPVNQRFPIEEILRVLREFAKPKEKFLIQYTLIRHVNDSTAHAEALIERLRGIPVKVNLIPLNEHSGASFRRPGIENISRFQKVLKEAGMVVTVRFSKGRDIGGACGQLVQRHQSASDKKKDMDAHSEILA